MYDLGIMNGHVYINNEFIQTNVYIINGIIKKISTEVFDCKDLYDCKGNQVLPGIIDPHTHFDLDLGFTKSKDSFYTGTKAAAFGGVTTIIDFLDPVDNRRDLDNAFSTRKEQAKDSVIDHKFHACLKNPKGHIEDLIKGFKEHNLNTIKVFTTYSDSGRRTYDEEIRELLLHSKENNYTVTVHVENDDLIVTNETDSHHALPINRPTLSETTEASKLADMVRDTKGRLYMVHISSGDTLEYLKRNYKDILNKDFIIESCPHYFSFSNDILHTEKGHLYTMAPPLRSEEEKQKLINHINDVYTIGTDHCVFTSEEKHKTLLKDIPLGVGGVEESFRVLYTKFGESIIPKMTSNVAKAHYLYPQKGVIEEGSDADIFIYKLTDTTINTYHSNIDHNIYLNTPVNGEVLTTISRGSFVVRDKVFIKHKGVLLHNEGGRYEGT